MPIVSNRLVNIIFTWETLTNKTSVKKKRYGEHFIKPKTQQHWQTEYSLVIDEVKKLKLYSTLCGNYTIQ